MIKHLFIWLAILGMMWMFLPLVLSFAVSSETPELALNYAAVSVDKLNVPNLVTSIVVSFRGLDTLGEVSVLFLATAGVGFILRKRGKKLSERRKGSEILKSGSAFLAPLIIVFGIYIFTHGHLSPGGGFQGGVVIASAFLLMALADVEFRFSHLLLMSVESLGGIAYVLIGLTALIVIGVNSFLDPTVLPGGEYLTLFSGGAIPIIYSLIGLKVGAELSSVIESMSCDGGKEC